MKRRYTINFTMLVGLLAGAAGVAPVLNAAEAPESASVSKLFSDAKRQAYAISLDAATLESFTRIPELSWESHALELDQMKADFSAAGKTVEKLTAERGQAAPWQVTAIDRIVPYLKEIAANTTSAIDYVNKNKSRPLTIGDYKDYLEANADTSRELATLIANFVDYGSSKSRSESLRNKLELPAKK